MRIAIAALLSLTTFHSSFGGEEALSLEEDPAVEWNDAYLFPEVIPDPLEPVNRSIGALNHIVMLGVVRPAGAVYRTFVRPPLRVGVSNVAHNLAFPVRLLAHTAQGQWKGAGVETKRFLVNSTAGIGGLFDAASIMGMPSANTDFDRVFADWGWNQHFYVMVPIAGPSSDRGIVASLANRAANPATYLSPLPYAFQFNRLSDLVVPYESFTAAHYDSYDLSKRVWGFLSDPRDESGRRGSGRKTGAIQTMHAVFLEPRDRSFTAKRSTLSVRLPTTDKRLRYTFWMRPEPAPLVFILPGLGGHRRGGQTAALAEMVYRHGYSAVAISSAFNPEFISKALTAAVPGNAASDARDIHAALTAVNRQMTIDFKDRITGRALFGVSMGGFHVLYLAAHEKDPPFSELKFDRYLAAYAPVDLLYGIRKLDSFFYAPLKWDESNRLEWLEQTLQKTVAFTTTRAVPDEGGVAFSDTEAQYLIGLGFRVSLRDTIFSSQKKHDLGVLRTPLKFFSRQEAYQEIQEISFSEYFESFVRFYYENRDNRPVYRDELKEASNLRELTSRLQSQDKIRLFINDNDFLLSEEDLFWYRRHFEPESLQIFSEGGHLGNLYRDDIQKKIMDSLDDLKKNVDESAR